jgi:NitT/TauT family transport system ATP-binding protein
MTIFMVTHDIREAFKLATRVLVFDKVRHDPDFPDAYGATITYDLKLDRNRPDEPGAIPLTAGSSGGLH